MLGRRSNVGSGHGVWGRISAYVNQELKVLYN